MKTRKFGIFVINKKLANRSIAIVLLLMLLILSLLPLITAKAVESGSSAECMAVIESSTNRLLYGKNITKKRPMASTTKIVTAITVLETVTDIDKIVSVPAKAVGVEGSSIYLQKDEKVSVRDLLYGLMLQSGNDCAETLAITTAGSIEDFALLMNSTALKAGAKNSNFVNPHGLHNDNHYTTAVDLARITSYAFKNATFKEIVGTRKHSMPWEGRDYNRIILNKNKILGTFDGGDGVKTGFTKKAGRCLVSSATRQGMQVICVVLNCAPMFEECSAFMEKAFSEYKLTKVCAKSEPAGEVLVREGKTNKASVIVNNDLYYPLREDELKSIKKEYEYAQNLMAPIKIGKEVGKIKIYLEKQLLFVEKLFTIESVQELSVLDRLKNLISDWNK